MPLQNIASDREKSQSAISSGEGMLSIIYELLLSERKIAYLLTDRDLKILKVSASVDFCPKNGQSCLGHQLSEICPEMAGNEEALSLLLSGELERFELVRINRESPSGAMLYLDMTALPYKDEEGQAVGLLFVVQDATEMGDLEQQLAQSRNELRLLQAELIRQNQQLSAANVELQHLSEVKSSFVSVAAHELRSPLASILGYTEVLLEQDFGELSAKQTEFLQIVQRSANRLLNVSMNLLDANRIETGRIDLLLKPLDLAPLIKGCVAEFEVQLRHKGQKLVLHIEPDLPMALCDETKTIQIINNLLSNASKYTFRGGKITVKLRQADEPGFLLLSVTDTGIGIASKEYKELFGRFFRASNAYQTGAGGSGLGLYITRSLVELHGGRIWVKSELNVGSTFFVTFPQN